MIPKELKESALPHVFKAGKSLLQFFAESPGILGSSTTSRLQLATWTTQIILGVISGALGVFIIMGPYTDMFFSGASFWTGAVATIAGVVAFIREKRRSSWWSFLKVLFLLATISTSIAAIVIGARDLGRNPFYNIDDICRNNQGYPTASPDDFWNQEDCFNHMFMLRNLFEGIRTMLFAVWIILLMVTLISIGFPFIQSCFCHKSNLPPEQDKDKKKLLAGEPTVSCEA
uniref:Transmembrane protein 176A-like n=1 Tax=Monodelphis domestica TaxID=13616 RepID=F7FAJ2_MONDO